MNMSNLTERIYTNLKSMLPEMSEELGAQFYQDSAPKSAQTPYIVFRVEDIIDDSPTYRTTIKFMFWDIRNKSSKENIKNADFIVNKFNRGQFPFKDMGMHSVLNLQQNIPSEYVTDKQCIEQQYDVNIYERTRYYE